MTSLVKCNPADSVFTNDLGVLTAFETNQSDSPEGADHAHPLQADSSTCD